MFEGDNTNPMLPAAVGDGRLLYNANVVPQSDVLFDCDADMVNMVGDNNPSLLNLPQNIRSGTPIFSHHHNLPVTPYDNNDISCQEAGQARNMQNYIPVSTGLRLSYGEQDNNCSTSFAGERLRVNPSSMLSYNDYVQTEFMGQTDELDRFIRLQTENMRMGITELKRQQTVSLFNALKKEWNRKINEKDREIENLRLKNFQLLDNFYQIAVEAESWQKRATHNESLVNVLTYKIKQASLQCPVLLKEGCGESVADDAVSSSNQNVLDPTVNHQHNHPSSKELVRCKACKSKEVSVLMLPCRHLCLCIDCDASIDTCPVCRAKKNQSLLVNMPYDT